MVTPSIEPSEFYAGDTVQWTRAFQDFPASGGWILSYKFVSKNTNLPIDPGNVTVDGDGFSIVIPASVTGTLNAGTYQLLGYISDVDGNRYVVANLPVKVRPDPGADAEPYDPRSYNQRVYDSISAMVEGRDIDEEHTMPDGRSLKRMPIKDLLYWQQVFAAKVMKERNKLPEFIGARFQ